MKALIKYIFLISICSCGTNKGSINHEDDFVLAYKKSVLFGCLNTATNGNFSKFSMDNNDLGLVTEVAILFHSDALDAKKLGSELSKKIRHIDYADYEGRRPIFSDCINFAFSRKIDSIAKERYKQLK